MIRLRFYNRTKTRLPLAVFQSLGQRAEKFLRLKRAMKQWTKKQRVSMEVTFLGDAAMTRLNAQFHRKRKPTDVISLSYIEKKALPPDGFIGEIFIDIPFAKRQARKIGQSLTEELRFLFVHGLLHIFGYDHVRPADEAKMLRLTYAILGRERA